MSLKGKAAIVGIADLKPSRTHLGMGLFQIHSKLFKEVLEDAGLEHTDIDGLLVTADHGIGRIGSLFAEYYQIPLRYNNVVDLAGATGMGMVWRAAAAISAGLCNNVVCFAAQSRDPRQFFERPLLSENLRGEFETPYGPMGANSGYALIASRHMYEYGTTSEQLAKIAVDHRTNAQANPAAIFYGKPITVDDVLNSRVVVDPLHLLEIVMPCEGGSALIVTSAERAKDLKHDPVYLLGASEMCTHSSIGYAASVTTSSISLTAPRAYAMAGYGPKDMDMVSPYDCYTITVLITLEDAGFCKKGEGGPFVQSTDLTYKGQLPCNTHGGQLSFGQPGTGGGMSHVTEAVRQLRHEAGQRQVADCNLAFVNGNGGVMSEECSLILGREVN